ncbi:unnamed protein product [Effrenium voratum]|nr:unnamed protein product [Effrenium voratum]
MEWFPLGGCTGLCQRKRLKAQTNNECGQPCSGSLLQTVFRRECYPDYAACVSETRDCVWSAWTSWSSTCFGDGRELRLNQRFRSRNVLKQALANGQLCIGPYNQTEPCIAETFERRDCGLSHWSEWTHCSRPCGGGWQARIRRVVQYASNGGTPCEDVTREQQPCHIEPCGGESCVLSEWGDWQGCDILSTAQEYRSRELLQPASDETPCDQTLRETRGCPEDDEVPEVCKLNAWTEWTVCSATCAGQQQRSRRLPSNQPRCFLDATVVGEGVPVQEIQACGAPRCEAAVCRLSVWTEWSGCSQGCGDGIHTRSREILESSAHASCDEALEQVRPCRMQDCVALDCVWADWDEWSACSCTCGGGTMRRNRVIQQSPRHGGRTCDPEEKGQIAPCATQSCEMCVDGRTCAMGVALRADGFYCPPLVPSAQCWHNYGLKWVRTYVHPQEQDLYYEHFNSGIYRASEALREQVIDVAVDEVLGTLAQLLPPPAARRAQWALSALHGLRYALCAVEFQECYQSEEEAADGILSFCAAAGEALAELGIPQQDLHTAVLIPKDLEAVVRSVLQAAQPQWADAVVYQFPTFLPAAYSPARLCDLSTLPLAALTNPDFAEGRGDADYRGVRVPQLSMEAILKRIRWRGGTPLSRWVVNLGAYDGRCGRGTECFDPANCLVEEQHFSGLLLEGNESVAKAMHDRLADERLLNEVLVRAAAVTPGSVAPLVLGQLPVREVDLLKIDVDSMPHDALLSALLTAGLGAKVIHTEIGPWFPPPVSYWREHDPSEPLVYAPRPEVVGLNPSLARVDEVLKPFGYELLQVELYDAIWVRAEYLDAFDPAGRHDIYDKWLVGAFCHPGFLRFGENFKYGPGPVATITAPGPTPNCPGRWSSWGSWSRCSATCSASYKARHRSVDRHPNYCGRPAVGLEDQYEVCENQPNCVPDKDCVLSAWSTWTGCSCKCFGVRERHRAVEQYASGNGKPCLEESLKFVEPCAPGPGQAVPTDCKPDPARPCQMGDWEEWQSCSASCDTGERKRARNILIPAADDGPPCEDPTEQVEPCNTQACHMTCVDCLWSQWSEWSACSHCGHQRYRHRGITRQANHCGKKCDTQAAKEVGFCPSKCEERYCVWSSWQDMGGCSAKCGPSTRLLHRELKFTTRLPEPEVEPIGNSGGLCRDALGRSYSGCPIQALSLEDCSEGLRKLGGVRGVQGAMFDRGDVVKFGARRCFILVDPGTMIQTVDVPGGWMKTPCIEGKGAGPITSAGTASGADTWKCLTLTNMPLIIGDPSVPCSGTQIYQSTCDSKPCRDECVPVDCELGEWSQWSEPSCTELCERSRTIARSNECGGKPCGGLLVETKRCYKNCTAPVDCKLGEWGSWAPAECMTPTDQKERERAVLVVAENGGRACAGVMRETMACSEDQEPVNDCELGQFSEWSACTATCGSGLRTQSRSIQVEASGGGSPCKGPLALLQPCSLGPCECPVTDAVLSQWGEWSGCNSGMHLRKRQVSQSAKCGGQPAKGGLMEVKRCGEVIDCEVSEWTGWDECDKSCGGGQQQRHRQVTRNPLNGGMRCPKDLVVTQGCNQEPCHATSCEVTEWEAWGECSSSCGSGVHERRRTFLHLAEDGGSGCDLPLSDMKPCSAEGRRLQSCPPTDCGCVWRDWSEWSACTCECGGGQKTRNRHIARAPLPGCTPCEPSDKQQILPCNTQKCQEDECVDGLWGLWQEWEPCSSTCKGGITWRMRKIARHASDCGRPVEGVSQHHASCNEGVSCVESTDCQLGEWAAWSACTQACDGVKRRSRQIAVQGRGDGAYCIGPMHQTYPCSTDKGLLEFSSPALYLHLDKLVEKNVDRGQAQLKYGDVTKLPGDESSVDLVVATSAMQSIDPERTGLHGSVGSVATERGTSVDVEFILMKSGTTEEVRAKMLMLKLFDLSDGSKLEVNDCDEPFLARETQLTVHGEDGVVITSQMPGTSAPKDPMSVSPRQEMQAAAILFKDTSRARVTFTSGSGEGLLFAGKACWSGDCLISACGRGDDSVDCVMNEWQPWGPCSVSCGRGQRVRSRTVQSLNSHGGRPCHTDLSETEGCRAVSCAEACEAQDCVWSDWSDWGACDKCGGQMKRFRNVITPSSCGGKGCEAEGAEETAKCPRKCHELSYCTWGDWGPFGECTSTCGHGIKRRTRRLKVVDEPVKSIIGESFMGTEDLKDKFHELQQRAVQLEAARSQQLVVAFACGFLGLVAFVAAGRRSSWATASDYSRVAGSDQE